MDLIELSALSSAELRSLLALAARCVGPDHQVITPAGWRGLLEHRVIALMFFEPSTRTRVSFELAAKRLGAKTALVTPEGSSAVKGEGIVETCENVAAMGIDAMVVRHEGLTTPHAVAARLAMPVLNAGNGAGEHPTQGLLDALVLCGELSQGALELSGRTVAIIGDVARSRVAASDLAILTRLGARVVIAGPPELLPAAQDERWRGVERAGSRDEALEVADAVVMLRIQRERMGASERGALDRAAYVARWGLDEEVAARRMRPGAPILHPGPVMVGVELSEGLVRHARSVILRQVAYGVAVRQAALVWALGLDAP